MMIPLGHQRKIRVAALVTLPILLVFLAGICGCVQNVPVAPELKNLNQAPIVFNDSLGNRIELQQEAKRIIAGNSAVAEMLVTIGAGDRIVGVTDSVRMRPEILRSISPSVKSIGTADTPDLETIITLNPDALLLYGPSSGHQAQNLEKLLNSNIRVITLDCYKLEGVSDDAYALGLLTNTSPRAQKYIEFNRKYRTLVESRLSNLTLDEMPVVYAESATDYTVLNRATGIGQILDFLHARNAYGSSTVYEFPKLTPEWVIEQNPDIILKSGEVMAGADLSEIHSRIINRTGFDQIRAVKNNRVYVYNSEIIGRPRVVVGMVYFAKTIYPERFADIDPESIEEEYEKEFGFGNHSMEKVYPAIDG